MYPSLSFRTLALSLSRLLPACLLFTSICWTLSYLSCLIFGSSWQERDLRSVKYPFLNYSLFLQVGACFTFYVQIDSIFHSEYCDFVMNTLRIKHKYITGI